MTILQNVDVLKSCVLSALCLVSDQIKLIEPQINIFCNTLDKFPMLLSPDESSLDKIFKFLLNDNEFTAYQGFVTTQSGILMPKDIGKPEELLKDSFKIYTRKNTEEIIPFPALARLQVIKYGLSIFEQAKDNYRSVAGSNKEFCQGINMLKNLNGIASMNEYIREFAVTYSPYQKFSNEIITPDKKFEANPVIQKIHRWTTVENLACNGYMPEEVDNEEIIEKTLDCKIHL